MYIELTELVEITEAATNNALFASEDLLQSLANCDTFDWMGTEDPDRKPGGGDTSETGDEGAAEDVLIPQWMMGIESGVTIAGDPSDLSQDETIGTPEAEGGANSPAAAATGTRGDGVRETPRDTEIKAVAEGAPPMDVLRERRTRNDIPVSSNRGGTEAPGARHEGEGLTIDELEGLGRLGDALDEQTFFIQRVWNDAMVVITNELVFTEVDTLVIIAKEAVERVIETSKRFISEAQDQAPGTQNTRGRKKPPQMVRLKKTRVNRSTKPEIV